MHWCSERPGPGEVGRWLARYPEKTEQPVVEQQAPPDDSQELREMVARLQHELRALRAEVDRQSAEVERCRRQAVNADSVNRVLDEVGSLIGESERELRAEIALLRQRLDAVARPREVAS
jgi:small-conductance mechanosensitive channel